MRLGLLIAQIFKNVLVWWSFVWNLCKRGAPKCSSIASTRICRQLNIFTNILIYLAEFCGSDVVCSCSINATEVL